MGLNLEPIKVVPCGAHPRTHQGGVLCSTWGTRLLRHVLPNHSQASHQWCFASKAAPDFFHVPPDCSCTTPLPLQAVSVQPTPLLFLSPLKPKFHPYFYAEYIMKNAGLDEAQAGIKFAEKKINNFRYVDDTPLWQKAKRNPRAS